MVVVQCQTLSSGSWYEPSIGVILKLPQFHKILHFVCVFRMIYYVPVVSSLWCLCQGKKLI